MGIESLHSSGPDLSRRPKRKNRPPNRGPVLSYRAFPSEAYFLIVRVADVAFAQSSAEVVPATFGANARYLPGLPLVFFEYDPVSVVVAVPAFFQPLPLALYWILTGTAATQSVKGGSSVDLTTPLALPLFVSFSVMDLVCSPVVAQAS